MPCCQISLGRISSCQATTLVITFSISSNAMMEGVTQVWDDKDAKAERELERQQRQAQEAAKQAALQAQVHSASAAIHQCIAITCSPCTA